MPEETPRPTARGRQQHQHIVDDVAALLEPRILDQMRAGDAAVEARLTAQMSAMSEVQATSHTEILGVLQAQNTQLDTIVRKVDSHDTFVKFQQETDAEEERASAEQAQRDKLRAEWDADQQRKTDASAAIMKALRDARNAQWGKLINSMYTLVAGLVIGGTLDLINTQEHGLRIDAQLAVVGVIYSVAALLLTVAYKIG